jgi:hypothetical protein
MATYTGDSPARDSARRAAARLVDAPLIVGSLVTSARTCGNKGCRCARGDKHVNTYLSVLRDGKRVMVCVPQAHLGYAQQCVSNYQQLQRALRLISGDCVRALLRAKKGHDLF